jgi:allophanate hydrolase subunit 2
VPARGVCSYLAVRGSFAVEPVLGSASRDVLAGIGPEPLRAGDVLAVGAGRPPSAVALDAGPVPALPATADVVVLDVVLGPRADWCAPGAVDVLTGQDWTVTPQSNRVGLRLHGPSRVERSRLDELPSEATVAGALQVPPSGQPVLFMADHPVTGGYPVIACVAAHHLDLAAQVPVGGRLRFRVVDVSGRVSA